MLSIKGQSNFKSTAKDILITSQLRSALIFNKKTKIRQLHFRDNKQKNIYFWNRIIKMKKKSD